MAKFLNETLLETLSKILEVFIKFGKTPPTIIAVICWVIIVIGSWIYDFHPLPDSYFSNKENILNILFAKWSLAWSLGLVFPYVALTSMMKSKHNCKVVWKNVLRLVVSYAVWYTIISILLCIENLTGECEGSDFYSEKTECVQEGLLWRGLDISGHSFLLTYCMLIISEEIQVVSLWIDEKFQREFVKARYVGNVLYVCCCLLMMLWMVLLAATAVYFHTMETKVIGGALGISLWYMTYKILFLSELFPGLPTGF